MWIFHRNWGTKNCSGHITKMAAMPMYVRNIKNSSSLEPKGWWPWKLICCIRYLSTTKSVQIMTLGWPWPILWQGQILSLMLLYGKIVKQWFFSEIIVIYDIKVDRFSQLNDYTKLMSTKGQGHLIGPNLSDSLFLNFFSSITTRPIEAKFHVEPLWGGGTKVCSNGPGHMTKMAVYGKNL